MRTLVLLALASVAAASCDGGGGGSKGRSPVTLSLPLAGIPLTTHAADGTVLEELTTDSSGSLSFDVPNGGSFAIYYLYGGTDLSVAHVIDPPSGSDWSFPLAEPTPQATPPLNATVTVTVSPAPGSATSAESPRLRR